MTVYDIHTPTGELLAFEIDHQTVGRRGVLRVVRSIPGVRVVRVPRRLLSWFREDVFCVFEIGGARFEIWEPFGDSSRYWIGPTGKPRAPVEEISVVRAAFARA
jgi:hypothetical protein